MHMDEIHCKLVDTMHNRLQLAVMQLAAEAQSWGATAPATAATAAPLAEGAEAAGAGAGGVGRCREGPGEVPGDATVSPGAHPAERGGEGSAGR